MLVISLVILPDLLIDPGVEHAWLSAQVRFEGFHEIVLVELLDRIIRLRVLQVSEYARLGRTHLNASRLEASRDAMVAERAFLRGLRDRAQEPAAVRAGLDAKAAANAVRRIDQHRPIRRIESRPHRAYLGAGRVLAEIAQLGHEERMLNPLLRHRRLGITMNPAVRRIHQRLAGRARGAWWGFPNDVAPAPGPEMGALGNVFLFLAARGAKAAADASV